MKILNLIINEAPTQDILDAIKTATAEEINYRNGFGHTPLHMAAWWGNLKIIRALIEKGADLNVVNDYGRNTLDLAKQKAYQESAKFQEVVEFLESYNNRQKKKLETTNFVTLKDKIAPKFCNKINAKKLLKNENVIITMEYDESVDNIILIDKIAIDLNSAKQLNNVLNKILEEFKNDF